MRYVTACASALGVGVRPARREQPRRSSARVRGRSASSSRPGRDHLVDVDAGEPRRERGRLNVAREHRLRERVEREAVARGDEVDRRAHQLRPHRARVAISVAQLARVEALEPRPQRDVRVRRLLRLHARRAARSSRARRRRPLQQPLAGEQRAVERAPREGPSRAHRGATSALRAAVVVTLAATRVRSDRRRPDRRASGEEQRCAHRRLGVGDGADGSAAEAPSRATCARRRPDRFFYLGDVYERGTRAEFERTTTRSTGRLARRTDPVLGNHEFERRAKGYYPYWAAPARLEPRARAPPRLRRRRPAGS